MSEKSRPYWGKDGNHYSDYFERNAADTRYEQQERLIKEQQEANKLAEQNSKIAEQNNRIMQEMHEQRLREERENAERIAEATRQAEIDRYENEKLLEQQRLDNQKEMRFYNICDEAGIDYNDIRKFNVWLNNYTLKQNNEQLRKIEKVQRKIYSGELKIVTDENKKLSEKIELKRQEKNNNMFLINNRKVKYTESMAETRIENVQKRIKNSKILAIATAVASVILLIMGIKDSYIIETLFWLYGIAFIVEVFCIGIIKGSKTLIHNLNEYINKEKILSQELKDYENEDKMQKVKINELFNKRQEELAKDEKFSEFYLEVDRINQMLLKGVCPNTMEFYKFRLCHYNEEMEKLLRKLELNLTTINKNDIKSTGTFKEYVDFIETKVDEFNTGFEDDEEYEEEILGKYKISLNEARGIINKLESIGAIRVSEEEDTIQVIVKQEQWEELKKKL